MTGGLAEDLHTPGIKEHERMIWQESHGRRAQAATQIVRAAWIVCPVMLLSGCATRPKPQAPRVERPTVAPKVLDSRQGLASYYGPGFEGRMTASGVRFDKTAMVAAHPTYPFGTIVRVTNLANGRSVKVRVIDRGPAEGPRAAGVVIDVSSGAAANLGFVQKGRTRVRVEVLRWGT